MRKATKKKLRTLKITLFWIALILYIPTWGAKFIYLLCRGNVFGIEITRTVAILIEVIIVLAVFLIRCENRRRELGDPKKSELREAGQW